MSDENDEIFHMILMQLVSTYALMTRIFRELPVPVALPMGFLNRGTVREALVRAAAVSEDQPMPEEQQFNMQSACLLWVSADNLLAQFSADPSEEHLAPCASACIVSAEGAALALGEWMVDQIKEERGEE